MTRVRRSRDDLGDDQRCTRSPLEPIIQQRATDCVRGDVLYCLFL